MSTSAKLLDDVSNMKNALILQARTGARKGEIFAQVVIVWTEIPVSAWVR